MTLLLFVIIAYGTEPVNFYHNILQTHSGERLPEGCLSVSTTIDNK